MKLANYIRLCLVRVWWDAFQLGQQYPGINIMDARVLTNEGLTKSRKAGITREQSRILKHLDKDEQRKKKT